MQNSHLNFPNSYKLRTTTTSTLVDIQRELWDAEYRKMNPVIPSSNRADASHALLEIFKSYQFDSKNAVDLGCGNGRNAFYLASKGINVLGIDFSDVALELMRKRLIETNAKKFVDCLNCDLNDGIPLDNSSYDLVLDSYFSCHFINNDSYQFMQSEIKRILKPKGKVIKIHLDADDSYYLQRKEYETEFGFVSYDKQNGIRKNHYNVDAYLKEKEVDYNVLLVKKINFDDLVLNQKFTRSIFVSILEKRID